MKTAVDEVIALLRAWQPLPKYSVERRIDAWLAPFLAPYFASVRGGEVTLVAAEFPIRKKNQGKRALTVNADFLLHRRPPPGSGERETWIIVELKTDGGSVRPAQFAEYFRDVNGDPGPARWRMDELLTGIEYVVGKTDPRFRAGYRRIVRRVRDAGDTSAEVEVVCVGPTVPAQRGITCVGLRKLTHWKPTAADQRALWEALTPLLRAVASSAKGRAAA